MTEMGGGRESRVGLGVWGDGVGAVFRNGIGFVLQKFIFRDRVGTGVAVDIVSRNGIGFAS